MLIRNGRSRDTTSHVGPEPSEPDRRVLLTRKFCFFLIGPPPNYHITKCATFYVGSCHDVPDMSLFVKDLQLAVAADERGKNTDNVTEAGQA